MLTLIRKIIKIRLLKQRYFQTLLQTHDVSPETSVVFQVNLDSWCSRNSSASPRTHQLTGQGDSLGHVVVQGRGDPLLALLCGQGLINTFYFNLCFCKKLSFLFFYFIALRVYISKENDSRKFTAEFKSSHRKERLHLPLDKKSSEN